MKLCAPAGYAAPRCGKAWCGLVGALGGKDKVWGDYTAYRIDPAASSRPKKWKAGGYAPATGSPKKKRRCSWGRNAGYDAAYLLSRHGKVGGDNREAAAVDIAVTTLLCGKKWSVTGKGTAKRLNKSSAKKGVRKAIKARAAALVAESRAQSGPYKIDVTAPAVAAGERVTVTATITARSGAPASNRKVVLRVDDTTIEANTVYTGPNGIAQFSFPAPAGTKNATVSFESAESLNVFFMKAKHKKSARLVLGGMKTGWSKSVEITTKQRPTVAVSVADSRIPSGIPANFTYSGSLGRESKTATVRLHGPFGSAAAASCAGAVNATTTRDLAGDGTVDVSGWMPGVSAYYRYSVTVSEDAQNTAAEACSAPMFLYAAQPWISNVQPTTDQFAGVTWRGSFDYNGGYGGAPRYFHAILWGPFTSGASCAAGEGMKKKQYDGYVTGNGTVIITPLDKISSANAGKYKWQITVAGDAANEPTSICTNTFSIG